MLNCSLEDLPVPWHVEEDGPYSLSGFMPGRRAIRGLVDDPFDLLVRPVLTRSGIQGTLENRLRRFRAGQTGIEHLETESSSRQVGMEGQGLSVLITGLGELATGG